jgi:hypothetical protein
VLSDPAVDEPLPDSRLDRDRQRLLGAAAFRVGEYARARAVFDRLAQDPDADQSVRRNAVDWRDRCNISAAYRP